MTEGEKPISFKAQKMRVGITQAIAHNREPYWIIYFRDLKGEVLYVKEVEDYNLGIEELENLYNVLK